MSSQIKSTYSQRKKSSHYLGMAEEKLVAIKENKNYFDKDLIQTVNLLVHSYFSFRFGKKFSQSEGLKRLGGLAKRGSFPKKYYTLVRKIQSLKTEPAPIGLSIVKSIQSFKTYIQKHINPITISEILIDYYEKNMSSIEDFSFDIYCPKTYSHHVRLTLWYPPFYLYCFSFEDLSQKAKSFLKKLKVKKSDNYVLGFNSRLDQYAGIHFIMLDLDSLSLEAEKQLKKIGGILFRSGRGYHFVGRKVIRGEKAWRKKLLSLKKNKKLKGHLDMDHVDISLKRGYSTLRITHSHVKPQIPFFLKEL